MTARKTTSGAQPTTTATKPATPPAGGSGVTPPPTDEGTEFLRQFRACAGTGQFLTEVDGVWYLVTPTDPPGDEWVNAQAALP